MKRFLIPLKCLLACLLLATVRAEVSLPALFADHMVLQRGVKLPVWGTAKPGEKVTVNFAGQTASATADDAGMWKVELKPLKASADAAELTVVGANTVTLKDVLVGDVWVCSGQSNMGFVLRNAHNAEQAMAEANFPQMRLFKVGKKIAFEPMDACKGKWTVVAPNAKELGDFSAVGYFFGKDIHQSQKVPVGLVDSSWGGTPAQSWTSLQKLESIPALQHYAKDFQQAVANMPQLKEKYQKQTLPQWEAKVKEWEAKPDPKGRKPRKPSSPDNNPRLPTVLFNGMINPLVPYAIKGAIWYQGEANANGGGAEEYATLFPAMITDWRQRWGQGDFPFVFVQLANWQPGDEREWAVLRNSQTKTLSLPKTGMAVTIDIGEEKDIHPKDKLDVGHRLALAARHVAYGEDIVYSGPLFASMKVEGDKAVVTFSHTGGGLVIGAAPPIRMDQKPAAPAGKLQAFEIAGADGKFVPAQAVIKGKTVVVSAPEVKEPKAVRYAWAGWPVPAANLYNKEGLPAVPFNTEAPATK